MRIFADRVIAEAERAFEAYGEVELFDGRQLDKNALMAADILLVRSVTRVDQALLDGTPVKFVGTATAGVDHVDEAGLIALGIDFHSAPGCNANAVAEFIATSVLQFCTEHNIGLASCSVAIIGHGQVGTRVESKLTALGCRCLLNDPPKAARTSDHRYVDLQTALQADIVTLHTPLIDDGDYPTKGLLDEEKIDLMSNCRLLINAARGGIVDEQALKHRLAADTGFNVQLDCWQGEPEVDLSLLEQAYLGSPHVAGHSVEARRNASRQLASALSDWCGIENAWLQESLEEASIDAGLLEAIRRFDAKASVPRYELLATIMQHYCPILAVDGATRELMQVPARDRAQHFDQLRRRFASRREFSHAKLPIAVLSTVGQNILDGLGFRY